VVVVDEVVVVVTGGAVVDVVDGVVVVVVGGAVVLVVGGVVVDVVTGGAVVVVVPWQTKAPSGDPAVRRKIPTIVLRPSRYRLAQSGPASRVRE
jgi:hypothetical protein